MSYHQIWPHDGSKDLVEPEEMEPMLREVLLSTKSHLDSYGLDTEERRRYMRVTAALDPMKRQKYFLAKKFGAQNCSNSWIKGYELIKHFELIPSRHVKRGERVEPFRIFCNAEFPGAFIFAINHYARTFNCGPFKWWASSILDVNEREKRPLKDDYELLKNYPNNWLMREGVMNGDVLKVENQLWMKRYFEKVGGVDLYTSDLGFNVSYDFNNQELIHAGANLGQIISGLLTLRVGGNFLTKGYSWFERCTVSFIGLLAPLFDEFHVAKPLASREGNSECYLVGKGFHGIDAETQDKLLKALDEWETDEDVCLDWVELEEGLVERMEVALRELYTRQIRKIQLNIRKYEELKDRAETLKELSQIAHTDPEIMAYTKGIIGQFAKTVRIRSLRDYQRLKCIDWFKHKDVDTEKRTVERNAQLAKQHLL